MFKLSIVTPEKVFYEDEVESLTVPGTDGYLGILSNHAPLITSLKPGKVQIRDKDKKGLLMAVANGFLEVSGNTATLLCDAAEMAMEIDLSRAETALKQAREHLNMALDNGDEDIDIDEEKAAIERAQNRIRIYKETH
jgi:F-type H+-transporting ATPase subunit epsilon